MICCWLSLGILQHVFGQFQVPVSMLARQLCVCRHIVQHGTLKGYLCCWAQGGQSQWHWAGIHCQLKWIVSFVSTTREFLFWNWSFRLLWKVMPLWCKRLDSFDWKCHVWTYLELVQCVPNKGSFVFFAGESWVALTALVAWHVHLNPQQALLHQQVQHADTVWRSKPICLHACPWCVDEQGQWCRWNGNKQNCAVPCPQWNH